MIFSTPEREFLRIAAMMNPDWDELVRLCRESMDYWALRSTALLHQLDGVVAWRLLDAHLDGVVPTIVREECQKDLDYLATGQAGLLEDMNTFITHCDKYNIPIAVVGGPIQYAPLGIPEWPRCWDDIEVFALVDSWDTALHQYDEGLIKLTAEAVDSDSKVEATYRMERGTLIKLGSAKRGDLDPFVQQEFRGIPTPCLSPANYLMWLGYKTWYAVNKQQGRLPLWGLARCYNWYYYGACNQLTVDRWDAIRKTEPSPTFSAQGSRYEKIDMVVRNNPHTCALWTARAASLSYPLDYTLPLFQDPYVFIDDIEYTSVDTITQLEDFLFAKAQVEGLAARLASGLVSSATEKLGEKIGGI